MFSIKNAVYVAIMQVGVIVVGVLAAGLCYKVWADMEVRLSTAYMLLLNHAVMFLAIPLVWITLVLWIRSRPEASDDVKNLAFWSGVLLIIALVIFVFYADVTPWFNIMWRMADDEG
jgi:magnesium-transporting ATPase (P-type)